MYKSGIGEPKTEFIHPVRIETIEEDLAFFDSFDQ
jgi:hypothetical protein